MQSKAAIQELAKLLDSEEVYIVSAYKSLRECKNIDSLTYNQRCKLLAITDQFGCNPLHSAASMGDLHVVRMLVGLGLDVNSRSDEKNTPLIFAVLRGHEDVVRFLIEVGADVNARNSNGYTACYFLRNCDKRILAMLYKAGADWFFENPQMILMDQDVIAMIMVHNVLLLGEPADFRDMIQVVKYRHILSAYTCLVEVANLESILNKRFVTLYMRLALGCDTPILEALSRVMQYDRNEATQYFVDIRNATSVMKTKDELSCHIKNQTDEIVDVLNTSYFMRIKKPQDIVCAIS